MTRIKLLNRYPWSRFCSGALLFTICLGRLCTALAAQDTSYPPPPFLPPKEHPRVYFMAKDIPRLLENASKPQNAKAWEAQLKNLSTGTDGLLPAPSDAKKGNTSSPVLAIIESCAFDYALRGDTENGQKAIAAMRNYIRTVVYPTKDYNNTGQTVFTIGIVYDWCYPLLSQDDQQTLIQAALDTAARMEIGWPPVKQGNVTGHGPEAQIFRDILCAAIAMYDEKPEMYELAAGRFFSRMVETKRFMYPAHMHHQGNHYTNYRGQWEMLATWIFDRMGLPEVFGPDQHYLMYWTLYARRPDGLVLHDGDTHIDKLKPGEYYKGPSRTIFLAANYFNDPYLKMEALRERPQFAPSTPKGNQALDCVELLIFNNPDLEPRPFTELPLTKYFPSPKGGMIARTGWEDGLASSSVVAEMKINEWYFANHQHLDAGAFQIYYRGMLATDSGYYQALNDKGDTGENDGSTGYGSLYDINYNKRTVAHNTITVYDPKERFESRRWSDAPMSNDGGQRFPNRWDEPKDHSVLINPANGYRIAEVLGHGFGPDAKQPDYTYLKGDLTRAYSEKMKAFERSFVFLNMKQADHPAVLIVFDRVVSSNPAFRKAWLLHGLEEPEIAGNRTLFKDSRKGYTGKLTVDTLLPVAADTEITKIGGPDQENRVDGVNYKALLRPDGVNESGGWRIEVSPKTARETDYFLHVLQVGDHKPDIAALPVNTIETETLAGLRLADRVVIFAKARDRSSGPVSFSFSGSGECQILVADLQSGTWMVERDGKPVCSTTVSADDGVAIFRGEAGAYRLVPKL
jgi:hypothetical protein